MTEWPHDYDDDDGQRRVDQPRSETHKFFRDSPLKRLFTALKEDESTDAPPPVRRTHSTAVYTKRFLS